MKITNHEKVKYDRNCREQCGIFLVIKGTWSGISGNGDSVKANFGEHFNLFLRNKGTNVNFHREQGNMHPPGRPPALVFRAINRPSLQILRTDREGMIDDIKIRRV